MEEAKAHATELEVKNKKLEEEIEVLKAQLGGLMKNKKRAGDEDTSQVDKGNPKVLHTDPSLFKLGTPFRFSGFGSQPSSSIPTFSGVPKASMIANSTMFPTSNPYFSFSTPASQKDKPNNPRFSQQFPVFGTGRNYTEEDRGEKFVTGRVDQSAELLKRLKNLELQAKVSKGSDIYADVSYDKLCSIPSVKVPEGFHIPKFEKYEGIGHPVMHLRSYCGKMRVAGAQEDLLPVFFVESLTGSAAEWYNHCDPSLWSTWEGLARAFLKEFDHNVDNAPTRTTLASLKKKPNEDFRDFAFRWRDQAARVDPPMSEKEMVEIFLRVQDETYYSYLLSSGDKPFSEMVRIGSHVEAGLREGLIVSVAAIRVATQAAQSGSGGWNTKKKDVLNIEDNGRGSAKKHGYDQNESPVFLAQAPAVKPQIQNDAHQFGPRKEFTPLSESYTTILRKLVAEGYLKPVPSKAPDVRAPTFDPNARCEYHSTWKVIRQKFSLV